MEKRKKGERERESAYSLMELRLFSVARAANWRQGRWKTHDLRHILPFVHSHLEFLKVPLVPSIRSFFCHKGENTRQQ